MQTWIEVDQDRLRHNLRLFDAMVDAGCVVAPVIKSNAYGHGTDVVLEALRPLERPWVCVNTATEAGEVRKLGFSQRILIVGPVDPDELPAVNAAAADLTLTSRALLSAWLERGDRPPGHLKIDTGLSRQGFLPSELGEILQSICARNAQRDLVGFATHFANVEDVLEQEFAHLQLQRFHEASEYAAQYGLRPLRHAAASAACMLLPDSRLDMVRVGISFYGYWPSRVVRLSYVESTGRRLDLRPALSWHARAASVREIPAGAYVSYGCAFRAQKPMTVAVVPVGYFEGYPRLAGEHHSFVLMRGTRCAVLGRVCMNMMVVDVSHLTEPQSGERLTLIGEQLDERVAAEDLASWSDTIQYEVVARLYPGIARVPMRRSAASPACR